MLASVRVRSYATLDFMRMRAENRTGYPDSVSQAYDPPQNCEGGRHQQQGSGGWLSAGGAPEAGHSTHVRWVGE